MTVVHILTEGFATPNGRAFLAPILYHKAALRTMGLQCRLFLRVQPALTECDALLVDSKFYRRRWGGDPGAVLEQLHGFRNQVDRLLWFDTTDSAGTLQSVVLPIVDRYYKSQLLKDRWQYLRPFYGGRPYTDYYHAQWGVTDEVPDYSEPVYSQEHLAKLGVSWNSGLANYSLLGPLKAGLYSRFRWDGLLAPPARWVSPSAGRKFKVSARFGAPYPKATVRFQRERIREILGDGVTTQKLRRRAYFRELEHSLVAVSPFGLGEITLRDFEAFLNGCLVVKPDMSHMETWPDLFQSGSTVLSHRWDLTDFREVVEEASRNYETHRAVADWGQENYKGYLVGGAAAQAFACRFRKMVG